MIQNYFNNFLKAWDESKDGKLSEITAEEFLTKYKNYEKTKQEQYEEDFLSDDPPGCFQC